MLALSGTERQALRVLVDRVIRERESEPLTMLNQRSERRYFSNSAQYKRIKRSERTFEQLEAFRVKDRARKAQERSGK